MVRLDKSLMGYCGLGFARTAVIILTFLSIFFVAQTAKAGETQRLALLDVHNLETTSVLGAYYLKQEVYLSVREMLKRVGREQSLGEEWEERNPWWRQAEEALIERVETSILADFGTFRWVRSDWNNIVAERFTNAEVNYLIAHFSTIVGQKQARLIDHSVARQVMMSLSFSGKLKSSVTGLEEALRIMQDTYNEERDGMRFETNDLEGADAQAFALSPLGKKYFSTVIISLTGRINEELFGLANKSKKELGETMALVEPYVEGFIRDR